MNKLKELLDSLGEAKHILNEYCKDTDGCANCPFYKEHSYTRQYKPCCWNVARNIEELECRIIDLKNLVQESDSLKEKEDAD